MSFRIEPAGMEAAATLVEHRRAMFFDMSYRDTAGTRTSRRLK
jgi:hypothetical protein